MLVSTVVEPSVANEERYAVLFLSKDNGMTWMELYREKKDFFASKYFQYGSLVLPSGDTNLSIFYAYGLGLRGIDDHMIIWQSIKQ